MIYITPPIFHKRNCIFLWFILQCFWCIWDVRVKQALMALVGILFSPISNYKLLVMPECLELVLWSSVNQFTLEWPQRPFTNARTFILFNINRQVAFIWFTLCISHQFQIYLIQSLFYSHVSLFMHQKHCNMHHQKSSFHDAFTWTGSKPIKFSFLAK